MNKPFIFLGVRFAYALSHYQQTILRFAKEGKGHAVVKAVAGSGKSTTLEALVNFLDGTVLAIAFNRTIADALKKRFRGNPNVEASTLNSAGFKAVRQARPHVKKWNVFGGKYSVIVREYVSAIAPGLGWTKEQQTEARNSLTKLASLARTNLVAFTDLPALEALAIHHGVRGNGYLAHLPAIMTMGMMQAETGTIDYDDQVYLPIAWGLTPETYDNVLVDEAQDLNPAQRELAILLCKGGVEGPGRLFFVGDPVQAIYGFTGADADSIPNIIERTKATVLPLSVCYRCPSSHLDLAREICPEIEPRPGAPVGTIGSLKTNGLAEVVRPGLDKNGEPHDLIICRMNAPLLALAIELIAQGIPARIRGRDVAAKLTGTLTQISEVKGFRYENVGAAIEKWETEQIEYLRSKDASDSAIEGVRDLALALDTCVRAFYSAGSIEAICAEIDKLFEDDSRALWLSSVHKAKGLEAERVFILRPDAMPLVTPNQQAWERQQEEHIRYVALTRAKSALYFVYEADR